MEALKQSSHEYKAQPMSSECYCVLDRGRVEDLKVVVLEQGLAA